MPAIARKTGSVGQAEAARAFEEAKMIGRIHERTILDVGAGFGRTAITLALGAAEVTAIDSSEALLDEARRRAAAQMVKVAFFQGDSHALQFKPRTFDVVVCLGVLQSACDWHQCLGEACRVADRLVIFDYPSSASVALVHSAARRLFGRERYHVLARRAVEKTLQRSQYRVRSVHRQYVLPMWFHHAIGSRRFTARLEDMLERMGLLKRWGTPVTICAERAT